MHRVAADDDAGVDRALGGDEAPDLLAGLRLDRVDAAVAEAGDQQPHAVDGRDSRRGVRGVVRAGRRGSRRRRCRRCACRARRSDARGSPACPSSRSAALTITRSPSTSGDIVRPPCVVNAANSSPIERSHSSLPSLLSAITCGADAERVDVAGFGIGGRRRPADAVRRHVALEDVELVFPDHLAGVGVERHHALLQRRRRGPTGSARRRGCP